MTPEKLSFLKTSGAYSIYSSENQTELYRDVLDALAYTKYKDSELLNTIWSYLVPNTRALREAIIKPESKIKFVDTIWIGKKEDDPDLFVNGLAGLYILENVNSRLHKIQDLSYLIVRIVDVAISNTNRLVNLKNHDMPSMCSYLYNNREHITKDTLAKILVLLDIDESKVTIEVQKQDLKELNRVLKPALEEMAYYLYGKHATRILHTAEVLGVKNDVAFWVASLNNEPNVTLPELPFI